MARYELNLHSRNIATPADPMRLLALLAAQPGDMAMLHSGSDGNVILAVNPIAGVLMEPFTGQIAFQFTGLAAVAEGRARIIVELSVAWQKWQGVLTGVSILQPVPELVGWLGWISYEAGVINELPRLYQVQPTDVPLAHWQLFERYFLFDADTQQWRLVALHQNIATATQAADQMESQLAATATLPVAAYPDAAGSELLRQPNADEFKAAVRRCQDYIAAGDIYQANLSVLWIARVAAGGDRVFTRLLAHNPAQYGAFMRYGAHELISASPELFLRRRGQKIETRPIKGTRPRDLDDVAMDQKLRDELLHSEKDRAELAMIVDLLRNDAGRICTKVRVENSRQLESLPTLWHTHGIICGELNDPLRNGWGQIIQAMCPGGSITGVPKIRAMQIIHELEAHLRGIYCGNIGWISPAGDGTLNIAIRTLHLANGLAQFRTGAGITADSDPDEEYEEILAKAAALVKAVM